uniref:Alkaline ceramidase n=1 Tax=Sus scrofa TaxID=9823 RepID=A0A8D0WWJ8_PIG
MTEDSPPLLHLSDNPLPIFSPSPVQQCHLLHLWTSHDVSDAPICPETLPLRLRRLHPLHDHRYIGVCDSGPVWKGGRDSSLDCLPLSLFPGLFSMYFHMTLSFLGQMLDEIAILWLLASGYSIWMPRCYFPAFLGESRSQFICLVITATVVSTFLSFLRPTINAYALNIISLHIVYIVFQEYKKTRNKELRHVIEVSVIFWAFALTSWVSDRLLCSFWQWINFSYLHSIWHVLISITFPYGMVTMALVDARYEMPHETLKIRYWPRDTWPVGLPYLEVTDDEKSC